MPARKLTSRQHMPTREQTSAGGIAFRDNRGVIEAALILTARERRWQLPKGWVDAGETAKQAALREVREEAGIECEIIAPVDTIEYWFVSDDEGERTRIRKRVHFYAMAYVSGSVEDHDDEVDEARWITVPEAVEMLAFASEKALVPVAESIYREHLQQRAAE